jgi:hypothetical protein
MLPGISSIAGFTVQAIAKELNHIGSNENGSALSTYTFSAEAIGDASADRIVLVAIAGYRNAVAGVTVTSVTVGGNACTEIAFGNSGGGNSCIAGIYAVAVPSGTTADIVVTLSGALDRCGIDVLTLSGGSTDSEDTDVNETRTASAGVSVTGGQCILGVAYFASSPAPTNITFTNLTEQSDRNVGNTFNQMATAINNSPGASTSSTIAANAASVGSTRLLVAF